MNLDNIISGRLPLDLPHLKGIVLAVPTKQDLMKNQVGIYNFTQAMMDSYRKSGYNYHEIDAEKDLLTKYPDFYEVIAAAEKAKNDILLSLEPKDTPDERFLKTPDEIQAMSEKEKKKYEEYYSSQFKELYAQYLANKDIQKSVEYMQTKVELYSKTIEHNITEMKRVYWLIVTARTKNDEPYFKDYQKGFDKITKLPFPEYSTLMEVWNGILDGIDFPF